MIAPRIACASSGSANEGSLPPKISRSHSLGITISGPAATPVRKPSDRKSTRLNSSHLVISYAVFCLKKKKLHLSVSHSFVDDTRGGLVFSTFLPNVPAVQLSFHLVSARSRRLLVTLTTTHIMVHPPL